MQRLYLATLGKYTDLATLGECYHYGKFFFDKDLEKAKYYYLQAAETGDSRGYFGLSKLYRELKDLQESNYYLGKAYCSEWQWNIAIMALEDSGTGKALYEIADIYSQERVYKIKDLKIGGEQVYSIPIPKEPEKSLEYLKKAAMQYYAPAIDDLDRKSKSDHVVAMQLGDMFAKGLLGANGEHRNIMRALRYYLSAANMIGNVPYEVRAKAAGTVEENNVHCTDDMLFELANIYYWTLKQKKQAIKWLVILERRQYPKAIQAIHELSNQFAFFHYPTYPFDVESTFHIGEQYQEQKEIDQALKYYEVAARQDHSLAFAKIESLAMRNGHARAQYILSQLYAKKNDLFNAFQFAWSAADDGDAEAERYVMNGPFNAERYRSAAHSCIYALENYPPNEKTNRTALKRAVIFYEKAIQLHDAESAYQLSELYAKYKMGAESLEKWSAYLRLAAEWDHPIAIVKIMEIAERMDGDGTIQLFLAKFFHVKREYDTSINWALKSLQLGDAFVNSLTNDFLEANNHPAGFYVALGKKYEIGEGVLQNKALAMQYYLRGVERQDSEAAFLLAEVYLNSSDIDGYLKKAYFYLAKSALWGNATALEKLEKYANEGDADAQYILGFEYHHARTARFDALDYAWLAMLQGHQRAREYIKNTIFPAEVYRRIANKYENTPSLPNNLQLAIVFYRKAIYLNHKEASSELGQLFLAHVELKDNVSEAFDAFLKAALLGDDNVLTTLECLGHDVIPELQLALGDFYQHTKPNQAKAIYWYQQASEGGCELATNYLKTL